MTGRTSRQDVHAGAVSALAGALRHIGGQVVEEGAGSDLVVEAPNGARLAIDVVASSVVSTALAGQLAQRARARRRQAATLVVVGDLIGREARDLLLDAGIGWFDRRGHLRLVAPAVWVDVEVPEQPRLRQPAPVPAVRGAAGTTVAVAHLLWGRDAPGARPLARRVGLSPAAISKARSELKALGLLSSDGLPAHPELFWAVARTWQPRWIDLARVPRPTEGLVATGTRAAAALGAPVVATADWPLELYAGRAPLFDRARLRAGLAERAPVARLAVGPTPLVADSGISSGRLMEGWPVAHPLFVALDLASDPARGVEVLESWQPEDFDRVW